MCISPLRAEDYKIVVGTKNAELSVGADALLAGDAEEGVRRTRAGLRLASSDAERLTGMSNLCAGYIMLERYDEALEQCNTVLAADDDHWRARTNRALIYVLAGRYDDADKDLTQAEELAPGAHTVKAVRDLLYDRVNPVEPIIIIDDRRGLNDEEGDSD